MKGIEPQFTPPLQQITGLILFNCNNLPSTNAIKVAHKLVNPQTNPIQKQITPPPNMSAESVVFFCLLW